MTQNKRFIFIQYDYGRNAHYYVEGKDMRNAIDNLSKIDPEFRIHHIQELNQKVVRIGEE